MEQELLVSCDDTTHHYYYCGFKSNHVSSQSDNMCVLRLLFCFNFAPVFDNNTKCMIIIMNAHNNYMRPGKELLGWKQLCMGL